MSHKRTVTAAETYALAVIAAAAGAVLVAHFFVSPFRYLSLALVSAVGISAVIVVAFQVLVEDARYRSRRSHTRRATVDTATLLRVAVVSPFGTSAIAGYIDGRRTLDGRQVRTDTFAEFDQIEKRESYDAAVVFEGLLQRQEVLPIKAERLFIIPRKFPAHSAVSQPALLGDIVWKLRDLERLLNVDPNSPSRGAMRFAKVAVTVIASLAILLVAAVVAFLAKPR